MSRRAPSARPGTAGRVLRWTALVAALIGFILVPFFLAGASIDQATERALARAPSRWWAGALIVALLAGDVLLPVPSSLLSTASGAFLGVAGGALATWLGMTLGCEIAYRLGRRAGHRAMERLVGPDEWARVEAATQRHGAYALLFLRAVPVLAEASVIFAGATRMSRRRYVAATAAANLLIAIIYAIIGVYTRGALTAL